LSFIGGFHSGAVCPLDLPTPWVVASIHAKNTGTVTRRLLSSLVEAGLILHWDEYWRWAKLALGSIALAGLAVYAWSADIENAAARRILPNGWRISPAGKLIETGDMIVDLSVSPDGTHAIAVHAGYNAHGLVVLDRRTSQIAQTIPLDSAWMGMAWNTSGGVLYVSGGTGNTASPFRPHILAFRYSRSALTRDPSLDLMDDLPVSDTYWSGLAFDSRTSRLYAANRGNQDGRTGVSVFDTVSRKVVSHIETEVNPYSVVLSADGRTLYVSNEGSASISLIDTGSLKVRRAIQTGKNPGAMQLAPDGRLFVACANADAVFVIDTKTEMVAERIATTISPQAPEGATPNALALDPKRHILYVANADNNDIAVVDISHSGFSKVAGFIPAAWYPSALAIAPDGSKLYVGNGKGLGSAPDIYGLNSPLRKPGQPELSGRSNRRGAIQVVNLNELDRMLTGWTRETMMNTPYRDLLLETARPPVHASVIPAQVGSASPIKHVIYIIKENRTYDQVLGDLSQGDGDPQLTIFGRDVTPNEHAIAEQFVLLDHLFVDGEVSATGHSWSDAAYATDFAEKRWPVVYSGRGNSALTNAYAPRAGFIWDSCARKGLTYRSYGEYGVQVSGGQQLEEAPGASGLFGHYAQGYRIGNMRDTDNAAVFFREFDQFEQNFGSTDRNKRLPNFIVMSLPEDHTKGTRPGAYTPVASVANNDYALGQIIDRVSHSRYWPETAIFVIEDDAQDGPDHVDARRTTGFVVSPWVRRHEVDSTSYTTSSMLRTIELLLGLPPMSQFDAAAAPMYGSFGDSADLSPFVHLMPRTDVNAKNTSRSPGALASLKMDLDDVDEAPMDVLNQVIWQSVKGGGSDMPPPLHRFLGH
jgi:YVTN family beta-propeller protein